MTTELVPYSSDNDSKQQQQSHRCKWFIETQSGSFYMTFLYHFNVCLQGNRIKGWKICGEYVNRLELYFFLLPNYYLIVHLYWMLLYDILLYKHVFENVLMYALCLYHAVCYFSFPFPPPYVFPWYDLYHFYYPALCFSPWCLFFIILPGSSSPPTQTMTLWCTDNQRNI